MRNKLIYWSFQFNTIEKEEINREEYPINVQNVEQVELILINN
jgi:hypothetical protein